MKSFRALLVLMIVLVCTAAAFSSSSMDPKVIVKDPVCPTSKCTPVGMSFNFGVPASGKGTLFFTNASGQNWTSLRLVESGIPASAISCQTNAFASCTVGTLANGKTFIFLSGVGGSFKGLQNGAVFSITFACVKGNCWPGGLDFRGSANLPSATAPEPTTIALLLTGVGGIVTRRKWLLRREFLGNRRSKT
jgi:hypothetical protein